MVVGAGIFKNPYASWMIGNKVDPFTSILYGDKNVKPLAPDNSTSPLPLSKYFRNAGVVIARDSWARMQHTCSFEAYRFIQQIIITGMKIHLLFITKGHWLLIRAATTKDLLTAGMGDLIG